MHKSFSTVHASFANRNLATTALTDEGSDANILPYSVLKHMEKVLSDLKVSTLERPVVYGDVFVRACATGDGVVTLDIYLEIRHGSNLILQNITWNIPQEEVNSPTIGRPVLESIGSNKGLFHNMGRTEDDGFESKNEYFEVANDPPEIIHGELMAHL